MGKPAAVRKADERARRKDAGQINVQEWVDRADVARLRAYAAKLRKARDKEQNHGR